MNLTCDEKKAAVITTPLSNLAKFLGISTIFQFQPTPKSNKHQSLHTVLNWSYILTRLWRKPFSGIFKSWRDHHNLPYFYVHILYQIVGFIHYKDGINKRRRIKRSFIVLHFAKSSDSPWLTKTLCATNFTKIRTFWSADFHHGLDPTM